ncbi:MAG: type I restriction enzyme S subunit [Pseudohongiellaceae bacterium]
MTPPPTDIDEAETRKEIDTKAIAASWIIQNKKVNNLHAGIPSVNSVAVREFKTDTGTADYILYIAGKACGIIEAKREGASLDHVAEQSPLNKAKQLLKQYRQSVLKAAVTGELTKQWRQDNKASLEGWQQSKIDEIVVDQTGKTPKRSNPDFWDNGKPPWLTGSATNNAFTHHADQFVTQTAVDGRLKLSGSDPLLLAMYGEGKTSGQLTEITFQVTCNQACAAITVDEEVASKAYVPIWLLENHEEIRESASDGNQPNLNLSKVRDIALRLLALAEQAKIVLEVEKKFDAINSLARDRDVQLLKAEKNKQSILVSAFSGKLQ